MSQQELTDDPKTWEKSSLVSVTQITPSGLQLLFSIAKSMKELVKEKGGGDNRLEHKLLATIFYEASTRTSSSFQAAMSRLGGKFIHIDASSKSSSSSTKKGESLSDTVKCLQCYCDAVVLRHDQKGSVPSVAEECSKIVINAGDGVGEHPTQALLDVFTIVDELNLSKDSTEQRELTICMLGDLKHSRTVHSLAKLLSNGIGLPSLTKINLRYCSPDSLQMPDYIIKDISQNTFSENVSQTAYSSLTEAIQGAHVLYVTRLQRERFDSIDEYNSLKGAYIVDKDLLQIFPKECIIMHPLPRVDEISTHVDDDPRAAYFRQMENGMFIRMAILALVLGRPYN